MSRGGFALEDQLSEEQTKLKERFCPDYTKKDKGTLKRATEEYDPLTRYVPSNRQWSLLQVLCMPPLIDPVKYKLGVEMAEKIEPAHTADAYVSDELWAHAVVPDYDVGDCVAFSGSAMVAFPAQKSNSTDTPSEFVTFSYMPDDGQTVPKSLWYGPTVLERNTYGGLGDKQYQQDYHVSYNRWYNIDGDEARLDPTGAPLVWPK
jgi:hypothetical protein